MILLALIGLMGLDHRGGMARHPLVFVWLALVAVPILVLTALHYDVLDLNFAPAQGSVEVADRAAHQATAGRYMTAAFVVALVGSLLGLWIAAEQGRKRQAWIFGLIFMLCGLSASATWISGNRDRSPTPAPTVTQCIERSGGLTNCPGG